MMIDKDFENVYFLLPNGNVYIGEPYENQKQLPRLNYADRDWYKGISGLVMSATSQKIKTKLMSIHKIVLRMLVLFLCRPQLINLQLE